MKQLTKEEFIKLTHPTYHEDKANIDRTDMLYENLLKACSWTESTKDIKDKPGFKQLQENIAKLQEDEKHNKERIC